MLEIPKLEELDSKKDDYLKRLEGGLEQIKLGYSQLTLQFDNIEKNRASELTNLLKDNDIHVEDPETIHKHTMEFDGCQLEEYKDVILITEQMDTKNIRKVEDIIDEYMETLHQKNKALEKQCRNLDRAHEDFILAILRNTQIKPLGDPNPDYNTVHLFTPREDGVYAVHLDMTKRGESGVKGPYKVNAVKPEMFDDPVNVETFKQKTEGANANTYLVTNPSKYIPTEEIMFYGTKEVLKEILSGRLEKTKKDLEEKGGAKNLASIVKKFTERNK